MGKTTEELRGLVLSAVELKNLTQWPSALVEDYLNLIDNLINISEAVDTKSGIIKQTVIVSTSPYTPTTEDQVIFVDTDSSPISISLPVGVEGTDYRIINAGSSGNNVTVIPALTDKLFGENASEYMIDSEVFDMVFNADKGWH
jgi:hypothetical protein